MGPLNPASAESVVLLVGSGENACEALREAEETLRAFGVKARWSEGTLDGADFAACAVIVASATGELPSRCAAAGKLTIRVPVAGAGKTGLALLRDDDGLLPGGSADAGFATMAMGAAGAKNAALFVVATRALRDPSLRGKWIAFRADQTAAVLAGPALTSAD